MVMAMRPVMRGLPVGALIHPFISPELPCSQHMVKDILYHHHSIHADEVPAQNFSRKFKGCRINLKWQSSKSKRANPGLPLVFGCKE